ncbi:helix-turn-helix transcriptional regulator, partial [Salipiger sp. HF18]|uniref:helix-turn-helix transcriptional regulator n=1 Tax=Salipiger sp. HF18 TaxID=2721557 RepID=UPI0034C5FE91
DYAVRSRSVLGAGPNSGTLFAARSGHDATAARSRDEDSLRLASGTFADVLEERFSEWRLTSAARDMAIMVIRGFWISEIAALRKTSEGRAKVQANAIFRKVGVSGRSQPMSVLIDELLTGQIGERL